MSTNVPKDPYKGREELRPYPVTLTITPTGVPARELPLALVSDVADVLQAHGLRLSDAAKADPALWSILLLALGRIVDNVPEQFGGRAGGELS